MKKILIYGDSNTWGDNFLTGVRISDDKQWPNILANKLKDYKILQEGLPGRLAGDYEQEKKYKNGKDTFVATYRTNAPVDVVIIALGTNDLQLKYIKEEKDIINSLLWYKEVIKESYEDLEDRKKYFVDEKMPRFIYILPPNFDYIENAKVIFDESCETKRQAIHNYFKNNIKDECLFINDISLVDDGIHLDEEGHKQMAKLVGGLFENE